MKNYYPQSYERLHKTGTFSKREGLVSFEGRILTHWEHFLFCKGRLTVKWKRLCQCYFISLRSEFVYMYTKNIGQCRFGMDNSEMIQLQIAWTGYSVVGGCFIWVIQFEPGTSHVLYHIKVLKHFKFQHFLECLDKMEWSDCILQTVRGHPKCNNE